VPSELASWSHRSPLLLHATCSSSPTALISCYFALSDIAGRLPEVDPLGLRPLAGGDQRTLGYVLHPGRFDHRVLHGTERPAAGLHAASEPRDRRVDRLHDRALPWAAACTLVERIVRQPQALAAECALREREPRVRGARAQTFLHVSDTHTRHTHTTHTRHTRITVGRCVSLIHG
jgi:hypothetical protein